MGSIEKGAACRWHAFSTDRSETEMQNLMLEIVQTLAEVVIAITTLAEFVHNLKNKKSNRPTKE